MKVTMQNPDPQTRLLPQPVVIVLETVAELNWAFQTFARSIHHAEVPDESQEQQFNTSVYTALNNYCVPFRAERRR